MLQPPPNKAATLPPPNHDDVNEPSISLCIVPVFISCVTRCSAPYSACVFSSHWQVITEKYSKCLSWRRTVPPTSHVSRVFIGTAGAITCTVTGPTVIDFQGRLNNVTDRCAYTLLSDLGVEVFASFQERRRRDVSFVDSVTLAVGSGDAVILEQGGRVLVSCKVQGQSSAELPLHRQQIRALKVPPFWCRWTVQWSPSAAQSNSFMALTSPRVQLASPHTFWPFLYSLMAPRHRSTHKVRNVGGLGYTSRRCETADQWLHIFGQSFCTNTFTALPTLCCT